MFVDLTARPILLPVGMFNIDLHANACIGDTALIPRECYKTIYGNPPQKERQVAKTPAEYAQLVTEWFFNGITFVKFNIAPHVVNSEWEVMQYFLEIMGSFAPAHQHKEAYLVYLLTQTCTSVEWEPK